MKRLTRYLSIACLLLAACSSSSEGPTTKGSEPLTMTALIDFLKSKGVACVGFEVANEDDLFPRESGKCESDGETIYLATYASAESLNAQLEAAKMFSEIQVVGADWSITVDTQAQAEQIQAKVGGRIA